MEKTREKELCVFCKKESRELYTRHWGIGPWCTSCWSNVLDVVEDYLSWHTAEDNQKWLELLENSTDPIMKIILSKNES